MNRIRMMRRLLILGGIAWTFTLPHDSAAQDLQTSQALAREHYYQGVFLGKQGKYVEAILELEKAIEFFPGYADAYNALGVVYYHQKEFATAIEQYLLAIESDPTHVKARTNLGILYNERQEYRKARQQLEKALEIDPAYAPAKRVIESVRAKVAELDANERERQQKEAALTVPPPPEKPSEKPPKADESAFREGTALIKQGKIDAGIRAYQQQLKRYPQSAIGYTLLGMAYREKYRLTNDLQWRKQEIAAFQTAVKHDPQYAPALLSLGEVLYEQGEIAQASAYFQKVLRYAPNHPAKAQLEAIIGQK